MTNSEAIQEDLRPYPVRRSLIERKCDKYGLDASGLYNTQNERLITFIVVELLSQMITLNNVAEGGVSLSFDKKAVETRIKRLCGEVGLDSSEFVQQPTVRYIGE